MAQRTEEQVQQHYARSDLESAIDDAAFARAWDEGLRMTYDEGVALALEVLGSGA